MTVVRPQIATRSIVARSLLALAMTCGLAACGTNPEHANTELGNLIDGAPHLTVAGEPVNVALLRRFYARHDFEPVWTGRQTEANALLKAVSRAGENGLDPELFHAGLLRQGTDLSPLDRELLLSDAFLSYADALARGAVPVERRKDDEALTPEPVDVAARLDAAIDSPDPAAVIDALAPSTPTYRALRQALRTCRQSPAGGAAGCARRIAVNLERQRWLPRSLPPDRVMVNVAEERLVLYRADRPVFSTRVVVGQDEERNQSPEFRAMIEASLYNPPWVIPGDIAQREILPKIRRDPGYLARNRMVMMPGGEIEQRPGPDAGLGLIMFDMPNRFDVYLHDTPDQYLFRRENRRISHGCIRVQNPRDFAALLMRQPVDAINQGIAQGTTTRNALPVPVPVFVVYMTAFVDPDGVLRFQPDFYNRDADIWQHLKRPPSGRLPVARTDRRPVSSATLLAALENPGPPAVRIF
ncbi:L,D-transpeptidase scaffold domain-containing protein [Gluconacetobacter takamatsuzukensis]|uniref:L,D-transpeptidase family protein n=1 Tax=Gluconacetobacter takamatsuzukensis TaxID=1286190 RepID=A0A7W4PQB2_9PROT|nr:L,D-transpeptidase family protein [Gluconacetobacter takamatsuzukensis]MBB2206168.1 L,D-transpeptidase family protein [Gluconacetobacter takamatsuzukensis]